MLRIHINIVSPLPRTRRGNHYSFTVQFSVTKWAEAFAIRNQCAITCAKVLITSWICRSRVPDSTHSDQSHLFESKVFKGMGCLLEINKTHSVAYHPEGNNLNKILRRTLKSRVEEKFESCLNTCIIARWITEVASIPPQAQTI